MPRRRRIENDAVVAGGLVRIVQKAREEFEGGNLQSTSAGQLLFHRGDCGVRQDPAKGTDHPLAIGSGRLLGLQIERPQTGDAGYLRGVRTDPCRQDIIKIGCRLSRGR